MFNYSCPHFLPWLAPGLPIPKSNVLFVQNLADGGSSLSRTSQPLMCIDSTCTSCKTAYFDSLGRGRGLRSITASKFPSDPDAAGPHAGLSSSTGAFYGCLLFTCAGGTYVGNSVWPGSNIPLKFVCFTFCEEHYTGTTMCTCWAFETWDFRTPQGVWRCTPNRHEGLIITRSLRGESSSLRFL